MFERVETSVASGGRLSSVWQRKSSMLLSCARTEWENCSLACPFELVQNEMIFEQSGASRKKKKKIAFAGNILSTLRRLL